MVAGGFPGRQTGFAGSAERGLPASVGGVGVGVSYRCIYHVERGKGCGCGVWALAMTTNTKRKVTGGRLASE